MAAATVTIAGKYPTIRWGHNRKINKIVFFFVHLPLHRHLIGDVIKALPISKGKV
jgi:hypothetical protein